MAQELLFSLDTFYELNQKLTFNFGRDFDDSKRRQYHCRYQFRARLRQ